MDLETLQIIVNLCMGYNISESKNNLSSDEFFEISLVNVHV